MADSEFIATSYYLPCRLRHPFVWLQGSRWDLHPFYGRWCNFRTNGWYHRKSHVSVRAYLSCVFIILMITFYLYRIVHTHNRGGSLCASLTYRASPQGLTPFLAQPLHSGELCSLVIPCCRLTWSSGVMRITVSVVVIMFELTGALTYILPTMVSSLLELFGLSQDLVS